MVPDAASGGLKSTLLLRKYGPALHAQPDERSCDVQETPGESPVRRASPRLASAGMPLFQDTAAAEPAAGPSSMPAAPPLDAASAMALINTAQHALAHGPYGMAERGLALESALHDRRLQVHLFAYPCRSYDPNPRHDPILDPHPTPKSNPDLQSNPSLNPILNPNPNPNPDLNSNPNRTTLARHQLRAHLQR